MYMNLCTGTYISSLPEVDNITDSLLNFVTDGNF